MFKHLALVCCLLVPQLSQADPASHREAASELMVVMEVERSVDQMYDQIQQLMISSTREMAADDRNEDLLEDYMVSVVELMRDEMSWASMESDLIDIYVDVYTEEELRGLADFYRSPLGQAFSEKMPQAMEASMAVSQEMVRNMMPKLKKLEDELREAVKARAAEDSD